MKQIHVATAPAAPDDDVQTPHTFVSLDGRSFLEIESYPEAGRAITAEDYGQIDELFKRRRYITLARRYLRNREWCRLNVTFHSPIEVA